jgi:2-isopropylmalate synthase
VSRGKDALGEVFVHVRFNNRSYSGKAASVDVIDASARAYLNAFNKAFYEKKGEMGKEPEATSPKKRNVQQKATGS